MAMSKPLQVLRWLSILPGAFLSAVLVTFPIHWLVELKQLFGANDHSIGYGDAKIPLVTLFPPDMLERFGYAFFSPLVMIIVGAKIAPQFRFQTGIALAVLWGMLFGAAISLAVSHNLLYEWGWLRFAITSALTIAGMTLGLCQVHEAQGKK